MYLTTLFALLRSQAGQVPSDQAEGEPSDVDTGSDSQVADTGEPEGDSDPFAAAQAQIQASVPAEGAQQPATPDTFLSESDLDPRTLTDPKLQAIFKRMQGVYTKKMQGISEIRQKADVVDRFYNDRDFAAQTLVQWAAQNGYQLAPIGAPAPGQNASLPQQQNQQGQFAASNAAVVNALKQNLQPELQWMAEPLAGAMGNVMQQLLQPLVQHQQSANQQQRDAEYDRHAAELGQQIPHWEEQEETMSELYDFLTGPSQSHPKYGSKLRLLYDLATSKAASIAEATKRINRAAGNRTQVARGGVKQAPPADITKMKKEDAWDFAVKQGRAALGR